VDNLKFINGKTCAFTNMLKNDVKEIPNINLRKEAIDGKIIAYIE